MEYKPSLEERWLRDLVALIHKDGSHHTTKVGLEQSAKDAREKHCQLQAENKKLKKLLNELKTHHLWIAVEMGKLLQNKSDLQAEIKALKEKPNG